MSHVPQNAAPVNPLATFFALISLAAIACMHAQSGQAPAPVATSAPTNDIPGLLRAPTTGLGWVTEVWVAGNDADRRIRELRGALGRGVVCTYTAPDTRSRWLGDGGETVVATVVRYPAALVSKAPAPSKPKPRIVPVRFMGLGEVA